MHTFFGGCCRGWYFQNERAPAVPVKGAGGQWLGLWEAARSSPAATHYYTDPLKSPTSFHSSSQKSNQLPYFLSKVQPAYTLPLKSPTSFHTSSQSPTTPSILLLKSPPTFHTAFQKSNHLPYFLSNVQPASILSLKSQTTFHTSSQSPTTPSILPLKSPSTFHTAFQKFNHLPYLLSKDQPALFGTSAVIFFTKMAVVEKSTRRCRIDCLAEG